MRIPVQAVAAAALICLGLVTGCHRTVPGTVAMTTQPGAASTTAAPTTTGRPSTTTSRPTTSPSRTSPTAEVPAPANAKTMKCTEYDKLDEATQLAVIRAILTDEHSVFPKGNEDLAKTIVDSICQFLPNSTVSEVLTGAPPR